MSVSNVSVHKNLHLEFIYTSRLPDSRESNCAHQWQISLVLQILCVLLFFEGHYSVCCHINKSSLIAGKSNLIFDNQ